MSLLNAESRAPPERWRGTGLSGVDQEACRGIALPRHLNGVLPKALSCAVCSSLFMLLRGSQLLLWLKNNLMTLYFHTESLTRDHPSISSILRSFHMSVFVGKPKGTQWSRHLNKWEEFKGLAWASGWWPCSPVRLETRAEPSLQMVAEATHCLGSSGKNVWSEKMGPVWGQGRPGRRPSGREARRGQDTGVQSVQRHQCPPGVTDNSGCCPNTCVGFATGQTPFEGCYIYDLT